MSTAEETVKNKWSEIKGEVQKTWNKLATDDIERTKGDAQAMASLVMQKYGDTREQFNKKYDEIVSHFSSAKHGTEAAVKNPLKT